MDKKVRIGIVILLNLIIVLFSSVYIELPGVYFDSAITDFVATTMVHPEIDNRTGMMMNHVGIPLLGNVYHGTPSMFIQLLVLHFAHGSVYTLRIVYILYVIVCIDIIYIIITRVVENFYAGLCGMVLCGTCVSIMTLTRTQYDIMLPGVCLFLFAVLVLYKIITSVNDDYLSLSKKIFVFGLCLGISFYAYFSFIFFAPVILLVALKYNGNNFKSVFISGLWGFLCGWSLYFCGYADSFITNVIGRTRLAWLLVLAFGFFFYLFLVLPVTFIMREKVISQTLERVYISIIVTVMLLGGVVAVIKAQFLMGKLTDFALRGVESRQVGNKNIFSIFFILFYRLISGQGAECQINGVSTSIFSPLYFIVWVICVAISVLIFFCKKNKNKIDEYICWISVFYLSFYICSLPLISGMQEQHFVPLAFLIFPHSIITIWSIVNKTKYVQNRLIMLLPVVLVFLNFFDDFNFYKELQTTRGIGAYSEQLNILFEEAYTKSLVEKDVYFLANPGIFPSFVYMTDNQIKVELLYGIDGEYDEDKVYLLNDYLSNGYNVYILSPYYDLEDLISDLDNDYGLQTKNKKNCSDSKGNLVYSICEIIE